ncbi:MAG TPA: hypothetical protein VIK31_12930 [Propionibacteriaceae bacterium]
MIVTAVALGLLILVVGVVVGIVRSGQTPVPAPSPIVLSGQADYQAGLSALASGETTKAADLLAAAAAAGNTAAKAKLAELSKEPTSSVGVDAAGDYTQVVSDLGTLLPTVVPGYSLAQVETSTLSAIVSAEPFDRTVRLTVPRVELSVIDKHTVARASAWVSSLSKAFPKQSAAVAVGDTTGRFGTDGSRLAVVAFSRGRFAYEVVVTVRRGTPEAQRSVALKLAGTFAAARSTK